MSGKCRLYEWNLFDTLLKGLADESRQCSKHRWEGWPELISMTMAECLAACKASGPAAYGLRLSRARPHMPVNKRCSGTFGARAACNIGATRFDVSIGLQPASQNSPHSQLCPYHLTVLSTENTLSTLSILMKWWWAGPKD